MKNERGQGAVPNRWIKEAYCASTRINGVSPDARDLWVRLLVNADDHGYFHGGAQLVASACFPLQPNARRCEQLLAELQNGDLIVRYEVSGKQYLAICQWYERPRSKPKYPEPPEDIRKQLQATACKCEQLHVSTTTTTTTTTVASDPPGFVRFWAAWPASERKVSKAKCREVWMRRKLDERADVIVAHVTAMRDSKQWRDGYDPAPLTYLNQSRWEDGLPLTRQEAAGVKWQ